MCLQSTFLACSDRYRVSARVSGALLAILLLAGCESRPIDTPIEPLGSIQWPAAPLAPRIAYLYSISSAKDVAIEEGWLSRAWKRLVGKRERTLAMPFDVHVDRNGRVYVVDVRSRTVHLFDRPRAKHSEFPSDPIPGFDYPIALTADDLGNVYVADAYSHQIHAFTDFGAVYEASFGSAELERPADLALKVVTNELIVVDAARSCIVVFDPRTHQALRRVGGLGDDETSFNHPTAIAISGNGGVLVSDSLNFRVQMLDTELNFNGSFGAAGDGPGYFSRPKGIAIDSEGHIYVADAIFDNVQIFDRSGGLLLAFGRSGQGRGEFWLPSGIFIDEHDRIYVADNYNSRIQVFQYFREQ